MRFRSVTTLCFFGLAALLAQRYPLAGLGICVGCLIGYLRPEPPGAESLTSREQGHRDDALGFAIGCIVLSVRGQRPSDCDVVEIPLRP